jgi:hypothetical protein
LTSTGVPVGGLPQSGGHTYRTEGLAISADTPTSASATTAMATNHVTTTRLREVRRGGAAW